MVGATLDRNGLRPGRWVETTDGHVVLGSESGLLDIRPSRSGAWGGCSRASCSSSTSSAGASSRTRRSSARCPPASHTASGSRATRCPFADLPPSEQVTLSDQPLHLRQRAFGYSQEDLRVLLAPMAVDGAEPVGSMGNDISLAVLSDQSPPLFSYFKQLFAQVTNPPIDPIREEIVMSLATSLGNSSPVRRDARARTQAPARPADPVNRELETLRHVDHDVYTARTIDITWPVAEGPFRHERRDRAHLPPAREAIAEGVNIIILNRPPLRTERVADPSLLAVAAVTTISSSRARACAPGSSSSPRASRGPPLATLIGFGASAITPTCARALDEMVPKGASPGWAGTARTAR